MKSNFWLSLHAAVFVAAVASVPVAAYAMGDEEFVGPFPSWANLKTNYGAVGDGVTDDTVAIQKALAALGPNNPTLYFPAGTYRITQTLILAGQQYVNVIGQDPATTTILWGGSSGGTMLYVNGVTFSRFDRLTFNGQGNAGVAVDQSKADGTSNYFDTGNEYADDVFENAGIGLRCGNLGYGCAETSMLRDQFINNTVAGVAMKNFNALDMWIWYSLFQNNAVGATNAQGAGNFHVYNSIFQRSTVADIQYGNTGVFNFRNNYSIGSNAFVQAGGTGSPDNVTMQGNTILDTTQALSIWQNDPGPVVFLDNIVRTSPTATTTDTGFSYLVTATSGPAIIVGGSPPLHHSGSLFSMGNTFSVGNISTPCIATPASPALGTSTCHEINDQVLPYSSINPAMPTLPGTPPNNNRQIFEASPTGSGTACTAASPCSIQQAITNAAKAEQSGAIHPVAHIAAGAYNISSTITVPATANSGIQIIGDGSYSQLIWAGAVGGGPVMRLLGPSKAILRDFQAAGYNSGGNSIAGIEVDNADQAGSRIFMEQAALADSQPNLFVDGLDYTNVELHDIQHWSAPTGTSINVTGGPSAAAGLWQGGATNIFAGVSLGNYLGYQVSNGARAIASGTFNDGGGCAPTCTKVANVTGPSTFTYAGSFLALPSGSPVALSLNNFQGTAALLNLYTLGDVDINGNGGTGRVLGAGLVGPSTTFFNNTSSPATTTEFLNGQADPTPGSGGNSVLPEQGCCDPAFLSAALNQLRTEQPTLLAPLASGVTDARFYRVFVEYFASGIHLKAGSNTPPPAPTTSLSANPISVNAGQSSTLSWTSTNATACSSSGFAASATSGSAVVTPNTTTSYSITCSGNGGSTTSTARVTVTAPPPPTVALSANPTSIIAGKSSTLSWNSTNATACNSSGFAASGISGSAVVSPNTTTSYSITCSGNGGSTTSTASVTVTAPPPPPTVALSANPTSIIAGKSSTLSWNSTNATSCIGTNFTASKISGSAVVKPSVTTSYSITCSGNGGSAMARTTVTVGRRH
jgi:hypothetical protein